jgi:NAD-dependent SIR2 family protein deacetylase
MVQYFECLGCHTITLFETPTQAIEIKPPRCSKCGCGTGIVRPNIRAGETITSRIERRRARRD